MADGRYHVRMKLIAPLLVLTLLLTVACGDDDDSPAAATATPGSSGGSPGATAPPADTATPPDTDSGTPIADGGSTESFVFAASPDPASQPALLVDVRVGAHEGFDRIVFEFEDGQRPSGIVGYKDEVAQCGSGQPVDPAGSHTLAVHFDFTNAHTEAGDLSIPSTTVSGPGNSILESESTCDFEAEVEWAVGVDGEKPFTVTLLEAPLRVVVDVAH
jgi:hypothetical protein